MAMSRILLSAVACVVMLRGCTEGQPVTCDDHDLQILTVKINELSTKTGEDFQDLVSKTEGLFLATDRQIDNLNTTILETNAEGQKRIKELKYELNSARNETAALEESINNRIETANYTVSTLAENVQILKNGTIWLNSSVARIVKDIQDLISRLNSIKGV